MSPSRWPAVCPTDRPEMSAITATHGETGDILLYEHAFCPAAESTAYTAEHGRTERFTGSLHVGLCS